MQLSREQLIKLDKIIERYSEDETMQTKFYDGVYNYLKNIGIEEI